jgi:hypothetical protein
MMLIRCPCEFLDSFSHDLGGGMMMGGGGAANKVECGILPLECGILSLVCFTAGQESEVSLHNLVSKLTLSLIPSRRATTATQAVISLRSAPTLLSAIAGKEPSKMSATIMCRCLCDAEHLETAARQMLFTAIAASNMALCFLLLFSPSPSPHSSPVPDHSGSTTHGKADCPSLGKVCDLCGKTGHLKIKCRQAYY